MLKVKAEASAHRAPNDYATDRARHFSFLAHVGMVWVSGYCGTLRLLVYNSRMLAERYIASIINSQLVRPFCIMRMHLSCTSRDSEHRILYSILIIQVFITLMPTDTVR